MMSLQRWFYLHAKRPLMLTMFLVAFIMAASALMFHRIARTKQNELVANAQTSLSIALSQKNRMLFENILESLAFQTGSDELTACLSGQVIFRYSKINSTRGACEESQNANLLHVPGYEDLRIYYHEPGLLQDYKVVVYLSLTFTALAVILGLFFLLIRKFQNEVLAPLAQQFDSASPHPIKEMHALQVAIQTSKESQVKLSVAEALVNRNQQIGHDIRSPLTALIAVQDNSHNLEPDVRELLEIATSRIQEISSELLNAAKKSNQCHVGLLIERLVKEKKAQLPSNKQIVFSTSVLPENLVLGEAVDHQKIIRIISNLINNSCEAIVDSGVVTIKVHKDHQNQILIEVTDTGCGLSAETVKSEEMFKASLVEGKSRGSASSHYGHGLGLSSAKKYIEYLGGVLSFNSQRNVGTTVRLQFPS